MVWTSRNWCKLFHGHQTGDSARSGIAHSSLGQAACRVQTSTSPAVRCAGETAQTRCGLAEKFLEARLLPKSPWDPARPGLAQCAGEELDEQRWGAQGLSDLAVKGRQKLVTSGQVVLTWCA
jgi:hypothetical protein